MPIDAGRAGLIGPGGLIAAGGIIAIGIGAGAADGEDPGRNDAPLTTAIAAGVREGPSAAGGIDPCGASDGDERGAGGGSDGDERGAGGGSDGDERGAGGALAGTDGDERRTAADGATDGGMEAARGAMGACAARGTTGPDFGNAETGRGGPWFLCFRSSDATAAPM